ncbi:ubiquitin conjugating enzyme [Trichophyton rubrum]|uniref:E2 ubiquitin-conjugating enzyme n=6 Tax=Trichophyton TaxID=5550 RepID=A0A178EPL6_TRIRU|nr:ubiquitin conjugating enzyme [Trichophyton rubrum]
MKSPDLFRGRSASPDFSRKPKSTFASEAQDNKRPASRTSSAFAVAYSSSANGVMASQKRISKELNELLSSPPDGVTVALADDSDLYKWSVEMKGPEGSPYQGGIFEIRLTLPTDYPFKPPTVSFATKIYHPNVSNDDKGTMCLGMLKSDEWKPSSKLYAVLEFARQLLVEPMPDDAVEGRIAEQYSNDRKQYEKIARDWTRKYASGNGGEGQ